MEKLNYEVVGKRATLECLLNGEIPLEDMCNIFVINIEVQEVNSLDSLMSGELFSSVNDENILFIQEID